QLNIPSEHGPAGRTLLVLGITSKQLEQNIANALAEDGASVRVVVVDNKTLHYFVAGHVKRPGSWTIQPDHPTLRDALIRAEGPTELHDPFKYITVVRRWPVGAPTRMINLDPT